MIPLSSFINAHAHYEDITSLPNVRRVLLIGVGDGLAVMVLRALGYGVTTLDNNPELKPDIIGGVEDLKDIELPYDCIIASHVLEHVPVTYFDEIMEHMARLARFALVYLPIYGKQLQVRLHRWQKSVDLSNPFDPYGKKDPKHFWEMGQPGWTREDLLKKFGERFTVIRHYRNQDWPASYNFVLARTVGAHPMKAQQAVSQQL